jgi:hypothetical protein
MKPFHSKKYISASKDEFRATTIEANHSFWLLTPSWLWQSSL